LISVRLLLSRDRPFDDAPAKAGRQRLHGRAHVRAAPAGDGGADYPGPAPSEAGVPGKLGEPSILAAVNEPT